MWDTNFNLKNWINFFHIKLIRLIFRVEINLIYILILFRKNAAKLQWDATVVVMSFKMKMQY